MIWFHQISRLESECKTWFKQSSQTSSLFSPISIVFTNVHFSSRGNGKVILKNWKAFSSWNQFTHNLHDNLYQKARQFYEYRNVLQFKNCLAFPNSSGKKWWNLYLFRGFFALSSGIWRFDFYAYNCSQRFRDDQKVKFFG